MKRQSKRRIVAAILCTAVLVGCSRTNEAMSPNSCSQNLPESSKGASTDDPSSAAVVPSSQQLSGVTQKIVYKEGPIGPGSGDYLEIPDGLNSPGI